MKIRLKFRNTFHAANLESNALLSDLLLFCSEVFKMELSNVQLSLNAKDYFGLEESTRTLHDLGIVSGDILYVKSLEELDDIKKYMENDLATRITDLISTLPLPQNTICSWVSVALMLLATDKDLHPAVPFSEQLHEISSEIVRLKMIYNTELAVHLVFTIFSTGNFINLACSVQRFNTRRQLMLLIRDYLVPSALNMQGVTIKPQHLFRNLQSLCIRVKDELLEPVLVDIHNELGLPERLLLHTLPSELLVRILLFLPLSALGKLMLTSSFMKRQIVDCNPVWRMHLNRLNAKNQPMLDAALTRQQRQRQQQEQQKEQQQPQSTLETTNDTTVLNDAQQNAESSVEIPLPLDEHSPSDTEADDGEICHYYDRFVARYRSLLAQRRSRLSIRSFV